MKSNGRNVVHDLLISTHSFCLIPLSRNTNNRLHFGPVSAIGKEVLDSFYQDGTISRGLLTSDTAEMLCNDCPMMS